MTWDELVNGERCYAFAGYDAASGGVLTCGDSGILCPDCSAAALSIDGADVDAQRAERAKIADETASTTPQASARQATQTTARIRKGGILLTGFDTEDAMRAVFERIGVAPEWYTIQRTKNGALRGYGVLWDC